MNTHKVLTWMLVIVIVVIGGAFIYNRYTHRVVINEFDGTISQKSPTLLTAKGFYNTIDYPNAANPTREVQITITPETKFTRVSYHIPTVAESQATNGFHLESLPHEYASGSLDELNQQLPGNVGLSVIRSTDNIYGKSSFTASAIEYKVMIFPQEPETR